jgi:succinate dehydrogenase hydrophobic anchor subunit
MDDTLEPEIERLTWRDIEALPYYIIATSALGGVAYALADVGAMLQTTTAEALLIFLLVALRHIWIGMEG